MQENIGFWRGLGMAWSSLVMTIVAALKATETTANAVLVVAESGHEATKVLKTNVQMWVDNEALIRQEKAKLLGLTTVAAS